MTYYNDVVTRMGKLYEYTWDYDNQKKHDRAVKTLEEIEDELLLLQTAFNHQVSEFNEWLTSRRKVL